MSKAKPKNPKQDPIQSIDQLQKRYDELSHERTRVDERLATTRNQLEQLRQQAKEQFGTDNVEELKQRLDDLKKENYQKREQYQKDLDRIENKLEEIIAESVDQLDE